MNPKDMLRTSEFWVTVATGIGALLVATKVIEQDKFDQVLMPAIVYIVARLTGKVAKAVGK